MREQREKRSSACRLGAKVALEGLEQHAPGAAQIGHKQPFPAEYHPAAAAHTTNVVVDFSRKRGQIAGAEEHLFTRRHLALIEITAAMHERLANAGDRL